MMTDSEHREPIEPLAPRVLEMEERSAQRHREVLDRFEGIRSRFERLHELSREALRAVARIEALLDR
jgi:hypothetical protein